MRLALYHPWVYLKSGLERSLLEIARRSRHEWTIFTHHYDESGTYPELADCDVVELQPPVSVHRSYSQVMLAGTRVMGTRLPLDQYHGLVVSSEGIGDFICLRNHSKPIICFCHTPLKILHDPQARAHYLATHRLAYPKYLLFGTMFRLVDSLAWRRYTAIVANSHETRRRIVSAGLASESDVRVLHPGIDYSAMGPTWDYQPYFLIPGRIMWQKNIELGINAFRLMKSSGAGPDFRLVIAGMVDRKSEPYYRELLTLAEGHSDIEFVIEPSDEEMHRLYQSSYAVLFTARNEDWGIVPLEGMAFGKPIVAVACGGPLESIVHHQTGYLLEDNPKAFARTMLLLSQNPALVRSMGASAHQHVARYDWDHFVSAFDAVVEESCKSN